MALRANATGFTFSRAVVVSPREGQGSGRFERWIPFSAANDAGPKPFPIEARAAHQTGTSRRSSAATELASLGRRIKAWQARPALRAFSLPNNQGRADRPVRPAAEADALQRSSLRLLSVGLPDGLLAGAAPPRWAPGSASPFWNARQALCSDASGSCEHPSATGTSRSAEARTGRASRAGGGPNPGGANDGGPNLISRTQARMAPLTWAGGCWPRSARLRCITSVAAGTEWPRS